MVVIKNAPLKKIETRRKKIQSTSKLKKILEAFTTILTGFSLVSLIVVYYVTFRDIGSYDSPEDIIEMIIALSLGTVWVVILVMAQIRKIIKSRKH